MPVDPLRVPESLHELGRMLRSEQIDKHLRRRLREQWVNALGDLLAWAEGRRGTWTGWSGRRRGWQPPTPGTEAATSGVGLPWPV
jgi:hypothetical protein